MEKKLEAVSLLCEQACAYYKPGRNEELACEGYVVMERLLGQGKIISAPLPRSFDRRAPFAARLRDSLCMTCAFHESDCDFMLSSGAAEPCGGFVVLWRLLEAGAITNEELRSSLTPGTGT